MRRSPFQHTGGDRVPHMRADTRLVLRARTNERHTCRDAPDLLITDVRLPWSPVASMAPAIVITRFLDHLCQTNCGGSVNHI
jgi:hypothetical protein